MKRPQNKGSENRKYDLRMPENWVPPYPSFESHFHAQRTQLAMAIIGCQFKADNRHQALQFANGLTALMKKQGRVDHVDLSECDHDSTGHKQIIVTGYWFESDFLNELFASQVFLAFWARHSSAGLPYGIFREVFNIPMERFETLHSGPDHVVGISNARNGLSDPIDRHAYWGGMRDRIPASSDNRFDAEGDVEIIEKSLNHIIVTPNMNLAIIRSGQDLSKAKGKERKEYFADIEPVLKTGMDFLRDKGQGINCYDCRFMRFIHEDGTPQDHTYGFSYFRSLEDLEKWAEFHPTHLAIFNSFMEFAPGYGPDMQSRFWHEVSVLPAKNQFAEYINCAKGTGLSATLI